jgi:hypothetical protein
MSADSIACSQAGSGRPTVGRCADELPGRGLSREAEARLEPAGERIAPEPLQIDGDVLRGVHVRREAGHELGAALVMLQRGALERLPDHVIRLHAGPEDP